MKQVNSKNPNDSIEGLPFRLIESLTDSMAFRNEGKHGWVLVFEKKLMNFKPITTKSNSGKSITAKCAEEKLKITIATKEDAYNIVKLTYLTYRYTYAKQIFYYPKELGKAIEEKRIISFIAKNNKGNIVINSAYFISPECDEIAEARMLMSRPEYRKNRALLKLSNMQVNYIKNETGEIKIAYSRLVTSHTKSQRLAHSFGFYPLSIECSVHDRADFIALNIDKNHRESLLYTIFADKPMQTYMDNELKNLGFFFSGIIIRTSDKWKLLYNLILGQHFDFDQIVLYHNNALLLKGYMKKQ